MMAIVDDTLTSYRQQVDDRLESLLPDDDDDLFRAARYAMFGGGKRIRPVLCLAASAACNGELSAALAPACAVEMIHSYSLIHDDLPSMDDDDFRRGRPTVHRAFDEAVAVLAGDYLLTYAFEVLAAAPELTDSQRAQLVTLIAQHAGGYGMVGGQAMDIAATAHQPTLEQLKQIHTRKTGALLKASVVAGGIAAGATSEELKALTTYGDRVGLAFQVVDDILDIVDSEAKHGKKVASDLCNDKTTYATLLGIDQSREYAQQLIDEAIGALKILSSDAEVLKELAQQVIDQVK